MNKKQLLVVGAIIAIIALFGFGKTDAKADQEVVTEWFSEPHPEYFVYADCVEETAGGENAVHYVYERYLWHDGKTWRATSKRLVPADYTLNKYITSRDYGGVGKNTKKYNLWLSKEYDYPVQEESGGGYNVVSVTGEQFHAWGFYTVTSGGAPTQYRYRYSRTHNEYITYLSGYYRIKTVPGKSFDVAGWGTESGTNLIIWDDIPPQANQTFLFSLQSDGSYIISDQNSGLCMDVDGDTVDGTNICMKTYNGGTSQRWYIGKNNDGTYTFVSALFKVFVADIEGGEDSTNGKNVWLWQWHGGQNQRFWIEPSDGSIIINSPEGSEEGLSTTPVDNEINMTSYLSNLVDGFELKNKNSGRMLNLYHGKTKDGSKFDTYPRDYTDTQLFWLISSDKGVQLKNACSADKRIDVKTNGSGTPKEGDAVCLYTPTSDDCSYWKINYCGQDNSGIYINIESTKTPGLFIGHPGDDLKGEKRNGLVLCTDGTADRCLWYIFERNENSNGKRIEYDREKAVEFARMAYDTSYQMCTSLASCCLYMGGIPQKDDFAEKTNAKGSFGLKAKITGVKALYNYLIENDIAELIEPVFISKYVIKYSDKIQPGDILMVKSNKGYHHNAVITAVDYDKDGNITVKFCQRNVARLDKKLYNTWAQNWNNKAEVYVLHIKDEVDSYSKRDVFVNRVKTEYTNFGEMNPDEIANKPAYMADSWCARFIWTMAKEVGCDYAIPLNKDLVGDEYVEAFAKSGGKKWTCKDIVENRYNPQSGDIIVYYSSAESNGNGMKGQHVGVVIGYSANDKSFSTIEGNTGSPGALRKRNRVIRDSSNGYTLYDSNSINGRPYWFIKYVIEPSF